MTAAEMKIEIVKRESIKPSTPTPHHLQSYNLCVFDQFGPVAYGPLVIFYPKNEITTHQRSQQLKKSLSQVLTLFYPLAGTIKRNISIDCNDEGVHFTEARVHGLLSDFLQKPNSELLHRFLPIEIESPKAATGPLFLVQASFFDCGGLAIGTCLAHKYGDATTLRTLLKSWSAIARGHSHAVVVPQLDAASQFPPRDFSIQRPSMVFEKTKNVTKRFVFDASKMGDLKAKAASVSVPQPSRVEAASALVWRSAMAAWRSSSNKGIPKHSALTHSVNLRKWVEPPLPENTTGNLIAFLAALTDEKLESQRDLKGLVAEMRKGREEFCETEAKRLGGESTFETMRGLIKKAGEMMGRDDINRLVCSSLCNFGLYETDFGWGKPIWVTIPTPSQKNLAMMIDTRDGGAEVWLCLSEEDMALFERDPELLEFASPNPSLLRPLQWRSSAL